MSSLPKSAKCKVIASGKIDGGAYRLVENPDGSAYVESWSAKGWVPGKAGVLEVMGATPVSSQFAARLGIPIEDLHEVVDGSSAFPQPLLMMIDPPGPFSTLATWEHYLTELEALPSNTLDRKGLVDEAARMIALKRQETEKRTEQGDHLKLLTSDTAADPNKKAAEAGFKPDYGLRLLKDGFSPAADLYFYEFRLFSISILSRGNYSTMVEKRYDGEMHALSLDFSHAQLERLLVRAEPSLAAFVRTELSKDPTSPRTIELDGYVSFAVRARLGCLQTASTDEKYIPLVTQEILYVSSNPSGSGKPVRA